MFRYAVKNDLPEIINLCEEHAQFEKSEYSRIGKIESLEKAIFSDNPRLYCIVLEQNGEIGGYATFSLEYSTWDADEYIHIDCWYLREKYRNRGIGWKFAKMIGVETIKFGKEVIQWQTPPFNESAIKLYKALGAEAKDKVRFYGDLESWKKFIYN